MKEMPVSPLAKGEEFELGLSVRELKKIVKNRVRTSAFDPVEAYEKLSDRNKIALSHLVKASNILDDVFLKQDHPDNIRAREILKSETARGTPGAAEALTLFTIHDGLEGHNMYLKKTGPLRLFKNKKLQPGKGFYPQDLTKRELADYILAHPEQAAAILANNTMVRREGDRLVAEPYSVVFREEMESAARELLLAASATDHAAFAEYLSWQAQALVNDSDPEAVFMADRHWIALEDAPLEFTVSRENYDDGLSGDVAADPKVSAFLKARKIKAKAKDSLGVRVGIVNQDSFGIISLYRDNTSAYGAYMPLKDQYKSAGKETGERKMTFADVEVVAFSGDKASQRGGISMAQNLPNGDKLSSQLGEGNRMVFHRQVQRLPDFPIDGRFLNAIIVSEQRALFEKSADFLFIIGHEIGGHSLGPNSTLDGRDIKAALGKWGNIIEENKADLISMGMADYLYATGKFDIEQRNKIYLTWMADQLPKKQPREEEAHRMRSIMQLNYFREKGAVSFEKGGQLRIVPEKMAGVARSMLTEVVALQLEGDAEKAGGFVKKYAAWNDALQYSADEQMKLKPRLYYLVQQPMRDRLSYPFPAP